MNNIKYELITCIVNAGFAVEAMEAAKKAGATGGTILRARGTANPEAEEFYNISIQPDKEILWVIVPKDIKDDVMHRLYQDVGLNTPGKGIAFSMPISNAVGLHE
ncbi:MAG: P-II family nitrogen regulator [Bacteroidales bacterium]|nr:P-II family nitrogen regulator [Bacteroidales bacterium]